MLLMVLDAEEAIKEDEIIEERTHFTRSRAKSLDSRTKPPAGEKPTVPPHALSKGYGPPPEWYSFAPVPSDYHGSYPSASPDTSDPWGPHGGSKHIELASKTFGQSKPGKSNNASIKQIQAGLQDLHSEVSSLAKMGLPELPPLYSKAKLEKRSLGVGYADEDDMGYPLWQDSDKEAAMESQYMLALSQEYSAVTSGWPSLSSPQGQLPSPHFGRKGRDELVRAKNRKSDFHNQRELAINLIAELMPTRRDDEGTTNELDWDPPEVLLQLLRSSSIRTIMADSLCDEVLNFDSDAIGLRTAVTNCLTSWSTHSRLKVLVTEDRSTSKMHLHDAIFGIEPSENLSFGEATHTSLFKTMSSLVVGCETTLKAAETLPSAYKRSKQLLDFCASVLGVFNILKDVATDPVLEEKPISPWSRLCKEDRVTYVEDEDILKGHHYEKEATRMKFSSGPRFKRLVEDVAILKTSLPDGIFVKLAYSRPDVMKFIIIGPEHTPYAGGLFEFHLFCPASYPRSPPLVWFPMAASAQLRLNPNLHGHGMVCISLIGTWSGIGGENWQPGKSTLLQLLVSMQSMIFCAEPYYNEPGFGGHEDKATSERYTNAVQALTIRLGLLHWLSDDTWKQSLWRDFIGTYMESQADSLVAVARSWGATNSHVTKYSGFREPMHVAGFYDPHGWSSEVPSLDAEIPVEVLQQIRSRMPKSPAKTQNLAQDLHDALVEFKKKLPGQKNGL
ncbi:MAG: hypothetical protein M1828_002670 [Chrysothrix sp. TS-e1954]|nr:MAG: hypothetical protein M1828_002670 [Chrysothrix sp. TS-e1954]